MDWRLRQARATDADALSLLASATFLQTYAGELGGADIVAHCRRHNDGAGWADRLADPAQRAVLAEHQKGAAPIGYSLLTPPDFPDGVGEGAIELRRLYVLSQWHGAGLGQALIERAIADARAGGWPRLVLGTHPGNLRARRFYEKRGFELVGQRRFTVGATTHHDPVYALAL